jgi:hypothetical protein
MKNYYFRKAVLSVFLSVVVCALLMGFGVAFGVADYGPPGTLASPEFSGLDVRGLATFHGGGMFRDITLFREDVDFSKGVKFNGPISGGGSVASPTIELVNDTNITGDMSVSGTFKPETIDPGTIVNTRDNGSARVLVDDGLEVTGPLSNPNKSSSFGPLGSINFPFFIDDNLSISGSFGNDSAEPLSINDDVRVTGSMGFYNEGILGDASEIYYPNFTLTDNDKMNDTSVFPRSDGLASSTDYFFPLSNLELTGTNLVIDDGGLVINGHQPYSPNSRYGNLVINNGGDFVMKSGPTYTGLSGELVMDGGAELVFKNNNSTGISMGTADIVTSTGDIYTTASSYIPTGPNAGPAGGNIYTEVGNIYTTRGDISTEIGDINSGRYITAEEEIWSKGRLTADKDMIVKGNGYVTGTLTANSFGSFYTRTAPTFMLEHDVWTHLVLEGGGESYFPVWHELTVSCDSPSHKAVYCGHTSNYVYMYDGNYPDLFDPALEFVVREKKNAYSCEFHMIHTYEIDSDINVSPYVECWDPAN